MLFRSDVTKKRGEVRINQLTRGSYFGEMALMGNKRRNATVRVSKGHTAKLVELGVQEFDRLEDASEKFKEHIYDAAGTRKRQLESTQPQGTSDERTPHEDPA